MVYCSPSNVTNDGMTYRFVKMMAVTQGIPTIVERSRKFDIAIAPTYV